MKEKNLIWKLDHNESDVSIFRTNYTYRKNAFWCAEDTDDYEITLFDRDTLLLFDRDSSYSFSKDLALYVYDEIMFDSLRFSTLSIKVEMSNFIKNSKHPEGLRYATKFKKEDIEKYKGKKLIQGKKGYEWVTIPKVDSLKCVSFEKFE